MNHVDQGRGPVLPAAITTAATAPLLSRSVYAVVALGIADLLADGPRSAADLAAETETMARPLHQVLRSVASTGLLRTEPDGTFALTADGQHLRTGHPTSGRDLILTLCGPVLYQGLGAVLESLRTGRPGAEIAAGTPLFEYYAAHPDEAAAFNRTMVAYHGQEPAAVAAAYDFSAVTDLVDVGGGIGTMVAEILRVFPTTRATVFDLPHVMPAAEANLTAAGVADRVTLTGGDFFEAVPAGAQAYLLSHILHDWDDDSAVAILRRCVDGLAEQGRVLVVEAVLRDDDEPDPAKVLDLLMLSAVGGSERTLAQFAGLFDRVGLEVASVTPTRSAVSVLDLRRAH